MGLISEAVQKTYTERLHPRNPHTGEWIRSTLDVGDQIEGVPYGDFNMGRRAESVRRGYKNIGIQRDDRFKSFGHPGNPRVALIRDGKVVAVEDHRPGKTGRGEIYVRTTREAVPKKAGSVRVGETVRGLGKISAVEDTPVELYGGGGKETWTKLVGEEGSKTVAPGRLVDIVPSKPEKGPVPKVPLWAQVFSSPDQWRGKGGTPVPGADTRPKGRKHMRQADYLREALRNGERDPVEAARQAEARDRSGTVSSAIQSVPERPPGEPEYPKDSPRAILLIERAKRASLAADQAARKQMAGVGSSPSAVTRLQNQADNAWADVRIDVQGGDQIEWDWDNRPTSSAIHPEVFRVRQIAGQRPGEPVIWKAESSRGSARGSTEEEARRNLTAQLQADEQRAAEQKAARRTPRYGPRPGTLSRPRTYKVTTSKGREVTRRSKNVYVAASERLGQVKFHQTHEAAKRAAGTYGRVHTLTS